MKIPLNASAPSSPNLPVFKAVVSSDSALGGYYSPGSQGRKLPIGSRLQRRSPGRWSDEVSEKLMQLVYRHCLQILTAETIKIGNKQQLFAALIAPKPTMPAAARAR